MIESLNKINAGAVDARNVVGGSRTNYTKQEAMCGLPDSMAGRLHGFIAQKALPDKKLMGAILESCRKHYLFVKYRKKWTAKACDLFDDEIDRLTYMTIWFECKHAQPTVRELAELLDMKRSTFHDNQYDVYLDLRDFINDKLTIAHRYYSKRTRKIWDSDKNML